MPPIVAVFSDMRTALFGSILLTIGAIAVSGSRWSADGLVRELLRWIGIALMIIDWSHPRDRVKRHVSRMKTFIERDSE